MKIGGDINRLTCQHENSNVFHFRYFLRANKNVQHRQFISVYTRKTTPSHFDQNKMRQHEFHLTHK